LFLLGTLSEESCLELRQHVTQGCPQCRERVKEAVRTVYLLGLTAKPAPPAPKTKADLLRLVKSK
jgi:hypothetical protein